MNRKNLSSFLPPSLPSFLPPDKVKDNLKDGTPVCVRKLNIRLRKSHLFAAEIVQQIYFYASVIMFKSGLYLVAQTVKNCPTMWETWVLSLDWEDPLEKEMATHSTILALRIPWTEEPGKLPSTRFQRVRHD